MLCRILLSISLASATMVSASADSRACGNAMYVDGDDAVKQVAEAERLLALGKLQRAEEKVEPHTYRFEDAGIQKRANIVWATVAFRRERAKADSWPVKGGLRQLEAELEGDADNPVLLARISEGYALAPDTAARARATLEDLAARDVMPDAYGYRTLARLRFHDGDQDAALAALTLCKNMSKRKKVCTLNLKSPSGTTETAQTKAPSQPRATRQRH